MSLYDVLSRYSTRTAIRIAFLVYLGMLLRLVALPLVVLALLVGRSVAWMDAAAAVPAVRGVRVGGVPW